MTADLKSNQATIRQRTQQLEAILSNIATGVILVDRSGVILTLNNSARKLLGVHDEDLKIENFPELKKILDSAILDQPHGEQESSWIGKVNGEIRNLTAIASPLKENNAIWGVVAVVEDVTYLVKGQREMAWREVAKRIAHEIKNPLTPIKLSAQRIQRRLKDLQGKDGQLVQECTQVIIQHTDELKEMVNEFSNFARLPEVSPVPQQLNALIQETMQLYLTAHPEIHFITRLEPALPLIPIDHDQMKRVILNLVDNGIAAIKSKVEQKPGRIEVETHYNPSLEMAALTIRDNGPGMSEEVQERAFEPYFSTKTDGTGLGLAIVKRIINDHGGYIRLSSTEGSGTTFMIELPMKTAKLET